MGDHKKILFIGKIVTKHIEMTFTIITIDTLQNVIPARVRRYQQCLDANSNQFENLYYRIPSPKIRMLFQFISKSLVDKKYIYFIELLCISRIKPIMIVANRIIL